MRIYSCTAKLFAQQPMLQMLVSQLCCWLGLVCTDNSNLTNQPQLSGELLSFLFHSYMIWNSLFYNLLNDCFDAVGRNFCITKNFTQELTVLSIRSFPLLSRHHIGLYASNSGKLEATLLLITEISPGDSPCKCTYCTTNHFLHNVPAFSLHYSYIVILDCLRELSST